jgi:hypothetical protein
LAGALMAFTSQLGIKEAKLGNFKFGISLPHTIFTGQLGTVDSKLGSFELGYAALPSTNLTNGITDHLAFSQTVSVVKILARSVSSTIVFTQASTETKTYTRSVGNSLTFVNITSAFPIHTLSSSLTFSEVVTGSKSLGALSSVTFTQAVSSQYAPHSEFVHHILAFTQTVAPGVVRHVSASNTITLTQSPQEVRVRNYSTSNSIAFSQLAVLIKIVFPKNTITFTQSVTVQKIASRTVVTPIVFTQSVIRGSVFVRSVGNTINFVEGQKKQINFSKPDYYYVPPVMVSKTNDVVVMQCDSQALVLPAPEMSDSLSSVDNMNLRRAMNGTVYTYVQRTGLSKLEYKFIMDRYKAYELRVFIQNNLSKQQTLTNWKGEIWLGYISNNPFNFTNVPGYGPCGERYECTVEFEGTQIH